MQYNEKIKNKNVGYFIVNGRVFNSLRKAEMFCNKFNFDVNVNILSENDDVLKKAKEICNVNITILKDIKESIEELVDECREKFDMAIEEFNKSETKHDILCGYKEKHKSELLGELRGIHSVIEMINKQLYDYEKVRML